MKMTIFTAVFAAAALTFGAESGLKGDLYQQKARSQAWKVDGNTASGVQEPNRWPSIYLTLDLEGNTFYRISYEYQIQDGTKKDSLNVNVGKKNILQHIANAGWSKASGYFYNAEAGKPTMQFCMQGPTAFRASFRDLKVEKLSPENLKKITIDFNENAGPEPAFFYKHSPNSDAWKLEIVPAEDFIDGGKALRITNTSEKAGCNTFSYLLPVELTKDYKLTFWAKAAKPLTASVTADGYIRGAKKHFYRSAKYQLTTEWKQYTHDFKTPTEEEHPQMAKRTLRIVLSLPKNSSAEFKNFIIEQK